MTSRSEVISDISRMRMSKLSTLRQKPFNTTLPVLKRTRPTECISAHTHPNRTAGPGEDIHTSLMLQNTFT